MKTFNTTIDTPQLARGLRNDSRNIRNQFSLRAATNVKAKPFGLVPNRTIVDPFPTGLLTANGISVNWPYPALFRGRRHTVLVYQNDIYDVADNFALTKYTQYQAEAPTVSGMGAFGEFPHFVDMGENWLLIRGGTTVLKTNLDAINSDYTDNTVLVSNRYCETGAYFQGRLLYAGFDGVTNYTPFGVLNENQVLFTGFSGQDAFWPFTPTLAPNVEELTREYLEANDAGVVQLPYLGCPRVMKPLRNSVLVFCETGVAALTPILEPTPSLGVRMILGTGIMGRAAVGGDMNRLVFVTQDGYVWAVDDNLQPTKLGYREFFQDIGCDDLHVSFDPNEMEYYLCTRTAGFVLTDSGLGKINQKVSSLIFDGGDLIGFGETNDDQETFTFDIFDLGTRGIKTIQAVELGSENTGSDVEVRVHYRFDNNSAFVAGPFVPFNKEGFAFPLRSGVDFYLEIRGTFDDDFKVDYVQIRWQAPDRRDIRGPSGANQTDPQ